MKYVLIALILTALLAAPVYAQSDIDGDMDMFSQSITTVDDITAGFVNPACLTIGPMMGLRYMHASTDSTIKGDDGFLLATRGNLLSIQWLKHTNGVFRRKFLFAGSKQMFPRLLWGLSVAYFTGNEIYDEKQVWKIGTLYMPSQIFYLGAVVDDINQPTFDGHKVYRQYMLGVVLNTDVLDLRLSADGWMRENQNLKQAEGKLRLEFTIEKKLLVAMHYVTEGMFQIAIGYNMGHIGVGVGGNFDKDDFTGGNFYYNQLPVGSR